MFSLQTKAAEENNGGPRKMPAAGQDAVANFESTGPSPPFPSMPPLFHPSMAPSLLAQQQHFPRQMGHGDSPAVGQPQQQPTGTPNFPTAVFSQFFHHLMAQQQRASANPGSGPALQPLPNGGLPPPLTGYFPPPVASSSSSGGNSPFPSPLHQFQHNLFLFQQQQQQSQSPKQQSPPIATMDPVFLQMLLLSAAGGGLPQQQTNISGADEATSSQTTAIARTATVKKLERDSDGNAICPACQRSIGKDSAQWAKHLEEERTQLQLAIQDLKEKALGNAKAHLADAGTRQSPSPAASASTENCSQQQKADRILTRIRDNQRNRIDAKLKGRFFLASLSLTNILKANNAATNQKCEQPPVQGNGHRHGEEEQETESTGKAEAPAVEEQTKSPFSTFCADGRNGRREEKERKPLCMQCQSHAELLVLNVHSGTAQCLDCFEQRKQQLQTGNGGPPTESSMFQPSNGHPPKATGNGFGTPAPMAKKRVSPFSALELAESNGVGTKERCEHEQQKRPKLEAE